MLLVNSYSGKWWHFHSCRQSTLSQLLTHFRCHYSWTSTIKSEQWLSTWNRLGLRLTCACPIRGLSTKRNRLNSKSSHSNLDVYQLAPLLHNKSEVVSMNMRLLSEGKLRVWDVVSDNSTSESKGGWPTAGPNTTTAKYQHHSCSADVRTSIYSLDILRHSCRHQFF